MEAADGYLVANTPESHDTTTVYSTVVEAAQLQVIDTCMQVPLPPSRGALPGSGRGYGMVGHMTQKA